MKHTQRFRIPDDWKCHTYNHVYFGLVELTIKLSQLLEFEDNKMIEIASYMGESTHIFGSCGLFTEINCIEPFSGTENFNEENNHTWEEVWEEYDTNIRQFKDIVKLHEDYKNAMTKRFLVNLMMTSMTLYMWMETTLLNQQDKTLSYISQK